MHLEQGSGYLLHLLLLDRQFSQHVIRRLRVRLSLAGQSDSDPDSDFLTRGMFLDDELVLFGDMS